MDPVLCPRPCGRSRGGPGTLRAGGGTRGPPRGAASPPERKRGEGSIDGRPALCASPDPLARVPRGGRLRPSRGALGEDASQGRRAGGPDTPPLERGGRRPPRAAMGDPLPVQPALDTVLRLPVLSPDRRPPKPFPGGARGGPRDYGPRRTMDPRRAGDLERSEPGGGPRGTRRRSRSGLGARPKRTERVVLTRG